MGRLACFRLTTQFETGEQNATNVAEAARQPVNAQYDPEQAIIWLYTRSASRFKSDRYCSNTGPKSGSDPAIIGSIRPV